MQSHPSRTTSIDPAGCAALPSAPPSIEAALCEERPCLPARLRANDVRTTAIRRDGRLACFGNKIWRSQPASAAICSEERIKQAAGAFLPELAYWFAKGGQHCYAPPEVEFEVVEAQRQIDGEGADLYPQWLIWYDVRCAGDSLKRLGPVEMVHLDDDSIDPTRAAERIEFMEATREYRADPNDDSLERWCNAKDHLADVDYREFVVRDAFFHLREKLREEGSLPAEIELQHLENAFETFAFSRQREAAAAIGPKVRSAVARDRQAAKTAKARAGPMAARRRALEQLLRENSDQVDRAEGKPHKLVAAMKKIALERVRNEVALSLGIPQLDLRDHRLRRTLFKDGHLTSHQEGLCRVAFASDKTLVKDLEAPLSTEASTQTSERSECFS